MALSLSEEDKKELKENTAELIALLEQRLEANNKKRNKKLMNVLLQTRNEVQKCKDKTLCLENENKMLKHQIAVLSSEIYDLVGRERAPNLIIHGVEEKVDEEDLREGKPVIVQNILNVFREVGIDLKNEEVISAERLGEMAQGRARPVLMKLSHPPLKKKVFEKGKDLYTIKKVAVYNDLTRTQRKEKKEVVAIKKLFDGAQIPVRIKGLSILWNGETLNWKQALDVYHRLMNSEFIMAGNSQGRREGDDTEDCLSEDSMISLESQESSRKKRRRPFSQEVLDRATSNQMQPMEPIGGRGDGIRGRGGFGPPRGAGSKAKETGGRGGRQ